MRKLTLAIVPGAEDGVGPELLLKALLSYKDANLLDFMWCGDRASLQLALEHAGLSISFPQKNRAQIKGGPCLRFVEPIVGDALKRQAVFLEKSIDLAKNNAVDALITGPINKACLAHLSDGIYKGQTDYLIRHLALDPHEAFMAFLGGPFLLSLVTTHVPLKNVSDLITHEGLVSHIASLADKTSHITKKPLSKIKITVLGLNPHAGEDGLLGLEEKSIIIPALSFLRQKGLDITGPISADGFFAYLHQMDALVRPDAVVALYHDQGLAPYKLLAKGHAVNITLGLSIPRTSPAHGTATYLSGTNLACPLSTKMALEWAIKLAQ